MNNRFKISVSIAKFIFCGVLIAFPLQFIKTPEFIANISNKTISSFNDQHLQTFITLPASLITVIVFFSLAYLLLMQTYLYTRKLTIYKSFLTPLEKFVSFFVGLFIVYSLVGKYHPLLIVSSILFTALLLVRMSTQFKESISAIIDFKNDISQTVHDFFSPKNINLKRSIVDLPLKTSSELDDLIRTAEENGVISSDANVFSKFNSTTSNLVDQIKYLRENSVNDSSSVICLDASWGAGKSSCINIVKDRLRSEDDNQFFLIDFNPWNFSNQTELIQDFFKSISSVLNKSYRTDISTNLQSYVELLTPLIEEFPFHKKIFNKFIKSTFDNPETLEEKKEKISNIMKNLDKTIVFFIDDIDRKTSDQLLPLMQLVSTQADLPNVIFVLSMDYSKVQSLISHQYYDKLDNYLQKIVHSTYYLPAFNYKELEVIFFSSLHEFDRLRANISHFYDWFNIYIMSSFKKQMQYIVQVQPEFDDKKKQLNTHPLFQRFQEQLFPFFYPERNTYLDYSKSQNRLQRHFFNIASEVTNGKTQKKSHLSQHLSSLFKEHLVSIFLDELKENKEAVINDLVTISNNDFSRAEIEKAFDDSINKINHKNEITKDFEETKKVIEFKEDSVIKNLHKYAKGSETSKELIKNSISNYFEQRFGYLKKSNKFLYQKIVSGQSVSLDNWIVSGLVLPRDVKQLAINFNYLLSQKDFPTQADAEKIISDVVMHQNFDFTNSFSPTSNINEQSILN